MLVLVIETRRYVSSTGSLTVLFPASSAELDFLQKSELLEKVSGCLMIPLVLTFTLLSLTRLLTWKGRSHEMDARRCAGSVLRRWEVRTLQEEADSTPVENPPEELEEPSELTSTEIAGRVALAFVSAALVSVSCWQGISNIKCTYMFINEVSLE